MKAASELKKPLDIDQMMDQIRTAVLPYPPAAMFQLKDEGYASLFEQLIACIISIRTYDETTIPVAHALFARARTPQQFLQLDVRAIDQLIRASTFHERKAAQMLEIARRAVEDFHGELPCDAQTLLSFAGVGIKCANLALGVACGMRRISVDIHVHRVTNRWGYVQTDTPEKTTQALEEKLPDKYWLEINRLLVPFGKHICTGSLPHCSTCPVRNMCAQVGVKQHR